MSDRKTEVYVTPRVLSLDSGAIVERLGPVSAGSVKSDELGVGPLGSGNGGRTGG